MQNQNKVQMQCASELLDILPWLQYYRKEVIRGEKQDILTLQELRVLSCLKRLPGSTLSVLADELGVNKATASIMIERMVQQNLVSRDTNPHNRREVILNTTTQGLSQLDKTLQILQGGLVSLIERLSEKEVQSLQSGLAALREMFKKVYPQASASFFLD